MTKRPVVPAAHQGANPPAPPASRRRRTPRPAQEEHQTAPELVLPNGLRVRGAGPASGWRSRHPVGPDGCLVIPREVIDLRERTVRKRALPADPYFLDG